MHRSEYWGDQSVEKPGISFEGFERGSSSLMRCNEETRNAGKVEGSE